MGRTIGESFYRSGIRIPQSQDSGPVAGMGLGTGPYPSAGAGFVMDREPPPLWTRLLREVSPKSDQHGFMHIAWEPGEWWMPCQRWTLYEMLHPDWIQFDLMEEYEGPNPRSEGHFCSWKVPKQYQCLCTTKTGTWRGGPCGLITLTQWKIFQQTGYVPVYRYWIVQGRGGGHKSFFSEEEQQWLAQMNLPTEPYYPGELPYADFDGRVLRHIRIGNALRRFHNNLAKYRNAMGPGYALLLAQKEREFRESVVKWLDTQMREDAEAYEDLADQGAFDNQATTDIDWDKVSEESMPHYIEHGQLLHYTAVT